MYSLISLFIGILLWVLGSFRIVPFVDWWFVYVIVLIVGIGLGIAGYRKEKKPYNTIPLIINIVLVLFLIVGTAFLNVFGGRP